MSTSKERWQVMKAKRYAAIDRAFFSHDPHDSMCDCDHCTRPYGKEVMPDRSPEHPYNPDCDCTYCRLPF